LALAIVLITLGGFVTSFRVGMADPVWPTEPWYLVGKDWGSLEFGFLVEHTHRLAGWLTGVAVFVLTLGAFAYEPDRRLRWFGLVSILLLLGAYGEFHRGMRQVWTQVQEQAKTEYRLDPKRADFESQLSQSHLVDRIGNWPVPSAVASAVFAAVVLAAGGLAAASGQPGGWVRAVASAALVCVMVQGLLGGFRVFLNALAGADLAAVHGVFAQVAFCVLAAVVVLAAPRREQDVLPDTDLRPLGRLTWALVGLTFVQLVWAVMVRHQGSAVAQRLHILTAFVVTGLVVWIAVRIFATAAAKSLLAGQAYHLLVILALQVLLGVEAYMGKFAAAGPQAQVPPMLREVRPAQAGIRTAHQLIGTGLLAAGVGLAFRIGRRPVTVSPKTSATEDSAVTIGPLRSPAAAAVS
jgi:heme A synthase